MFPIRILHKFWVISLIGILSLNANIVLSQENSSTIATETSDSQDIAIATRIREIMAELGNYDDVQASVNEGVVTLRGTATSSQDIAAINALSIRLQGVVAVKNEIRETNDIAERLNPALDRFQTRVDQLISFFPLALIALLVLIIIVFIGFTLARLRRPWDRIAPNMFVADIYRQLIRIGFVILGIVIALDILDATALLSTILGAAGIIGLALGFAVRDTVENFIASVMLSFRQPFRPNDTVEINGDEGKVIRLTSRATILLSFDGNHIRIPNATVFKSRIINYSQNAERRFLFSIMIEREADLQETRILVEDTVQKLPFILTEPAAQTWIEALHPSGVELIVTGWVDQNETSILRAKGEALRQVKLAILGAGVTIPDATQSVAIRRDTGPDIQPAHESTQVDTVDASDDQALERIVKAERNTKTNNDLLHENSPKE